MYANPLKDMKDLFWKICYLWMTTELVADDCDAIQAPAAVKMLLELFRSCPVFHLNLFKSS